MTNSETFNSPPEDADKWVRRRAELIRYVLPLAAIVVILVVGDQLSPGFARPSQVLDQLTIAAILGIVAAGQTIVIISGREGIDMSVGGVISIGALVAGNLMSSTDANIPIALLGALSVGLGIGIFNGLGVIFVRIPPLVMTLGTSGVIQGLLIILTNGQFSGRAAPGLSAFVVKPLLFGLPGILWIWMALALAIGWLLKYSRFGIELYAVGSNERAAALSGVSVPLIRIGAYGVSGLLAGLTGFVLAGYTGTVFISAGDQYMLPSVIAVVVGGTALSGGSGGYFGTALGAIMLSLLQSVLIPLNIGDFGRQIIFGLALLGFMLIYGRDRAQRQ